MTPSHAEVNEVLDPKRLIQRVADQALELIPAAEGVLIGLSHDGGFTYVCGSGYLSGHVGTTLALDTSLVGQALRTRTVLRAHDTETDPRVDADACRRLGVASSVCVPLCRADEALGVMAVSSRRSGGFSDDDVALLTRMADFLGVAVGLAGDLSRVNADLVSIGHDAGGATPKRSASSEPQRDSASRFVMSVLRPEAVSWMEAHARVQAVLDDPDQVSMMFQPIVDLFTDRVVAVEALARFQAEPLRSPDIWFNEAHHVGLGVELEMVATSKALALWPTLPDEVSVAVNVGPETFVSHRLAEALAGAAVESVVVELTEHTQFDDYEGLLTTLRQMRQRGLRLSVDDAGAGFSGLSHILKLAPDFIKLDRELVKGIDLDPVRRALTRSLVSFAADTGAQIVAEGVETGDELEAVRSLGVRFAQGYYLGRPGPLSAVLSCERPTPGPVRHPPSYAVGTGGAGTAFTRQVVLKPRGGVSSGAGEFPGGTLTIDAGQREGWFPTPVYYAPPDATPVLSSWGGAQRRLVITGEALVWATSLNFGEIDVLDGSTVTTPLKQMNFSITAPLLDVDATSQVTVDTRGYGYDGKSDDRGASAPGVKGGLPSG